MKCLIWLVSDGLIPFTSVFVKLVDISSLIGDILIQSPASVISMLVVETYINIVISYLTTLVPSPEKKQVELSQIISITLKQSP